MMKETTRNTIIAAATQTLGSQGPIFFKWEWWSSDGVDGGGDGVTSSAEIVFMSRVVVCQCLGIKFCNKISLCQDRKHVMHKN